MFCVPEGLGKQHKQEAAEPFSPSLTRTGPNHAHQQHRWEPSTAFAQDILNFMTKR